MNSHIWQPLCDESVTSDYDILYCRLSRDDGLDDRGSNSISNQKDILADFAAKNWFDNPVCVVDDGFTETNFQRPGWQLVLQEIENGNVRSIICKDAYVKHRLNFLNRIFRCGTMLCSTSGRFAENRFNISVVLLYYTQRYGQAELCFISI